MYTFYTATVKARTTLALLIYSMQAIDDRLISSYKLDINRSRVHVLIYFRRFSIIIAYSQLGHKTSAKKRINYKIRVFYIKITFVYNPKTAIMSVQWT